MFLYSRKGIEHYIYLFGNTSKMYGKVKFAINSDPQYFLIFAIFNGNVVKYDMCLKFILYTK